MTPSGPLDAVERLAAALTAGRLRLVTAESCTGGLIAAACTSLAGSSTWFERGFVVYSNAAKHDLLGVPDTLIAEHGAVSAEVARAMADGALARADAQVAVAVTGIAGPSGGSDAKPVGTVWLALAGGTSGDASTEAFRFVFAGDRAAVRAGAVEQAFALLLARCAPSGAEAGAD